MANVARKLRDDASSVLVRAEASLQGLQEERDGFSQRRENKDSGED